MISEPTPIANPRELPDVVFDHYTCYTSPEKAAIDFKARFGKEPTAIFTYVNPTFGFTTVFVTAEEI